MNKKTIKDIDVYDKKVLVRVDFNVPVIDGKITETLPLDEDTEKEIATENGGTNTLVIKDGRAKMVEANCPDGICKNHKAISRNGESIICLPHKVVVSVVDNNSDDEIDAVA